MIEAEEISASFGKAPVHINAVNVDDALEPVKDLETVRDVIRANLIAITEHARATGRPVLAHINHPNFRWAFTAEDVAHVLESRFFEVFNGHPMVYNDGHPDRADSSMERLWDIANTLRIAELGGPLLFGVGTDDSHNYHGGDVSPGRGWVMVRARELEAGALIEAMERGDFYASTGVTLRDVRFDAAAGRLELEIEPEPGVTYTTRFVGTRRGYDRAVEKVPAPEEDLIPFRLKYSPEVGATLAESRSLTPSHTLSGDELFVRAVVTASRAPANPISTEQRAMAWTQPFRGAGAKQP
jgi:hypothetical protein